MSNKLKMALLWGVSMTFVFCTMSFISILKGEDETASEIIKSFGAALAAGLATGVLAYFFSNKLNADKMFGKKEDKFK
jgi:xanthine/uracil permease